MNTLFISLIRQVLILDNAINTSLFSLQLIHDYDLALTALEQYIDSDDATDQELIVYTDLLFMLDELSVRADSDYTIKPRQFFISLVSESVEFIQPATVNKLKIISKNRLNLPSRSLYILTANEFLHFINTNTNTDTLKS
ncbi:MAG: hypothetical protein OQL06_09985 [Gammaproteobacteria bacterium]|nr:hypothetical protein [Gammaproteobacteria bacterium]